MSTAPAPAPAPPFHSSCFAPHSALYFRPDGLISACCTTGFSVGSVVGDERQSLREIWDGAMLAAQREALERDDFSLGCQECEIVGAAGGRAATLAVHFDRFAPGAPHDYPKLLDLALSSRCNLQCVMCNGELSSAIRTRREGLPPLPDVYDDRFFDELDEFLPHVERLQFKGGEPFLAPENRRIWDRLIELGTEPEITVTTNGTIMNDRVEHYLRALRMQPNVSVDGMRAETLESIRVGVEAPALWRNIDRIQDLSESVGRRMTLSFCMMTTNWREVPAFLAETDRRDVNCNVILVNQPHHYDLLRLPTSELADVRRALDADAPDLRGQDQRRAWDEVMARISAQIERPVEIVVRSDVRPGVPVSRSDQESLIAEIRDRHRCEPLVVEAEDGIITAVTEPDWASWLRPGEWRGLELDGMGDVIGERIGPQVTSALSSGRPGVELVAVRIETPDGVRRIRVWLLIDADSGHRRAMIVEHALEVATASA